MFTPKVGEDFQFDDHIFQRGWNHQLEIACRYSIDGSHRILDLSNRWMHAWFFMVDFLMFMSSRGIAINSQKSHVLLNHLLIQEHNFPRNWCHPQQANRQPYHDMDPIFVFFNPFPQTDPQTHRNLVPKNSTQHPRRDFARFTTPRYSMPWCGDVTLFSTWCAWFLHPWHFCRLGKGSCGTCAGGWGRQRGWHREKSLWAKANWTTKRLIFFYIGKTCYRYI